MRRKNHLSSFIAIFSILIVLIYQQPNITHANHSSITATLYQYERLVEERRFETAKELLFKHKKQIRELFKGERAEVKDDLLALVDANIQIVDDPSVEWGLKIKNALALVLAVDSIKNANDPIWFEWKSEIVDVVNSSSEPLSMTQLQQIKDKWTVMIPALKVSLSEKQFDLLEHSFLRFTENPTQAKNAEQLTMVFRNTTILDVSNTTQKEDSISFIWLIFMVGGVITLTLTYVLWKKYKGEKNRSERQPIN